MELGERLEEALAREVLEETEIRVAVEALSGIYQYIERDADDRVAHHYVVADYRCRFLSGEPHASSDVDDARFVPVREIEDYALNEEALKMIREVVRNSDLSSQ